jgi:uncharacterized protein YjlB
VIPNSFLLEPNGPIPNNQHLPVVLYREAIADSVNVATAFETQFANNGWGGSWRNGVYDYHHYHTHAHEVLGIARGMASLLIGGPDAKEVEVRAGDCIVLPAGTGHCRSNSSTDFLVVGAYPPGQKADIKTGPPSTSELYAIRTCPLPQKDPVNAGNQILTRLWHF